MLNTFPKFMQPGAKAGLRQIWQAETRAAAEAAMDTFAAKHGAKYEKAVTCLTEDREAHGFKLVQAAAKTWRRLKGANQVPRVIEGVTFVDGVATHGTNNRAA